MRNVTGIVLLGLLYGASAATTTAPVGTAPVGTAPASPPALTITNVTLIDGTGAAPRAHITVHVADGRIVDITPASANAAPGDGQIDGTGRFLVPGFFDNNAHLTVYGSPRDAILRRNTGIGTKSWRSNSPSVP